jgi:hypothetical protein
VDVGHRHGGPHDPREAGYVRHLLQALVLTDSRQETFVGEHQAGDIHPSMPGDAETAVVNLLDRNVRWLGHRVTPVTDRIIILLLGLACILILCLGLLAALVGVFVALPKGGLAATPARAGATPSAI